MPDIVTLTINPAVDIFVNVARVEPTAKMRCSAPKRDPGGGGINVARVVHRLDGSVAAIYPTGGAIGKLLHRLLDREGIDSIVTPSHVETRENFTAFEQETGLQYRFVLPGSPLHPPEWEAVLDKLANLTGKPRIVVASGSVPPGVPDDIYADVARRVRKLGAKMVIDTSGPALAAALAEGVTLIKPNQNELSDFVGKGLDNDADRIAACRKLIDAGRTQMVALTLGEEGAILVTRERALRAEPMRIEVASAVGAGDSFLGGLVTALAKDAPLEEAFRLAVAAGSAAVMSPGTELCSDDDVRRMLPRVVLTELVAVS
ncbi:MAG TPA: 1-phosphofructokinase family hexose kinase [Pseudolabrys sp.]